MKLNSTIIFVYALIVCIALYITENIYHPNYLVQMIQKIGTFLAIPMIIGYLLKEEIGKFGKLGKASFLYGIGFGILSVIVIGVTYYLLQDQIKWEDIRTSISARGVNETTFLFVFAYITFGNSLVEEYFFRGIIFRTLYEKCRTIAYVVSALMFSLYHITIFGTWFSGYIIALALVGLFVGGIFFAWLYKRTGGIWGAWIFHIFADLTILVIGYKELFM